MPITKTRTARSDEWLTPKWLFDHFDAEFRFTFDGAARASNTKCARFPEGDGLLVPWHGETVWLNPPYSEIGPWMEKAFLSSHALLRPATVVCLVPNAPDTHWWADWVEGKATEIRLLTRSLLPTGRVHFEKEDGWSGRAGFSSVLVVYRPADFRKSAGFLEQETRKEDHGHALNPKCAWWGGEPCNCNRRTELSELPHVSEGGR